MVDHPAVRVEDVVHQRVRLGVLALLSEGGERSFTELRDTLGQSDGGLGRHLKVLAEAGYITLTKSFQDNRPRTGVALTDAGRAAVRTERRALTQLVDSLGGSEAGPPVGAVDLADPANGREPRQDAAALFASPPDLGRPQGKQTDSSSTAERILAETYASFYVEQQWPFGPGFGLPEGFPEWPSYPAQRLTFLSHGLRSGYFRRWTTVSGVERISVMLLEFAADTAPEAILGGLAESSVYVPGSLPVRAYQIDGALSSCVIWVRRGRFLACITVSGAEDIVQNRAITLAKDQYRRLPYSTGEPAETPVARPIAERTPAQP